MKIVPIQLQIPTLNSHGAVIGAHPVPFYLVTPTGKTDDGRGLAYALSHEDAQDICDAFAGRAAAAELRRDLAGTVEAYNEARAAAGYFAGLRAQARELLNRSTQHDDGRDLDTADALALLRKVAHDPNSKG